MPTHQNGDLLLAFIFHNNGLSTTGPAGGTWSEVRTSVTISSNRWLSVWKRIANNEPSTYDWTLGAAVTGGWAVASYRPAHGTSAVAVETGQQNANSTTATAPTITPDGSPRTLVVAYVMASVSDIGVGGDPSGMTLRINRASSARCVVYDEPLSSASATGTRAATLASTSVNNGHSMILRGT